MSSTLATILPLVSLGDVLFSEHAVRELAADRIIVTGLLARIADWVLVEDYPNYFKGPCVLVLVYDDQDDPVHMLWGIARGRRRPAVLITAYRPNPSQWSGDFLKRRSK